METLNNRILTLIVLAALLPFLTGATIIIRGPRVAPAAASTLDDFSGLQAWYKTPISGATNGAAIPGWEDSKNAYDLTSPDDPIYNTSDLNGYDTVTFDTKWMNGGGSPNDTLPYTLVAVVRFVTTGDYQMILGCSNSGSGGGLNWRTNDSTSYLNTDKAQVAGIGTGNVAVTTATWHVLICVVTSSTWAFWIDGTAAGSGSHSESLTAGRTFTLGGDLSGSAYIWKNKMVEVGVYNTDRTADVAAITSAMQAKYGL